MKDIAIYGAGGFGKEVELIIRAINAVKSEWNFLGYFDDNPKVKGNGSKILGGIEALKKEDKDLYIVIAIGDPNLRMQVVQSLNSLSIKYATLIHPKALLMNPEKITVEKGVIIAAGCVITTDVILGKHSIVNLNTTIGHDASIGAFTSIMCGVNVAGGVTIKDQVFIGSGANILNQLIINNNAKVGAGAVVTKDIPANKVATGVPARWS